MANYSVKMFRNSGVNDLEVKINEWLNQNIDIKIIDISNSTFVERDSVYHKTIIFYEKE